MIFNVGSGAPSGETLVVTAPAGVTVTASKDTKTKTKVADANGNATFKGLTSGTWTVTISDGTQTSSRFIEIVTGYSMTIGFFSATINTTYPSGSTCTCTDGSTTLTASDTSGSYAFLVPNAGTWTITSTDGDFTKSETVSITTDGQNESIELMYRLYLFNSGDQCTDDTGGWIATSNHVGSNNPNTIGLNISGTTMQVYYTGTNKNYSGGSVETTNAIDMSKYSKIYFDIASAGQGSSVSAATNTINSAATNSPAALNAASGSYDSYMGASIGIAETTASQYSPAAHLIPRAGLMSIDLTEFNSSYKVIVAMKITAATASMSVVFNSIYLE